MYLLNKPSLLLLINLILLIFCNISSAASIPRRDPSNLINIHHREPAPEPVPVPEQKNNPHRLTISGHGVVAVPISSTGERVHVDINTDPKTNTNTDPSDPKTRQGIDSDSNSNSDSDLSSEYIKLVKIGETTLQIIGTELTITESNSNNNNEDPTQQSQPEIIITDGDNDNDNNKQGVLSDERFTPGQLAAMGFAKSAGEILAGKEHVLGVSNSRTDKREGFRVGKGQDMEHRRAQRPGIVRRGGLWRSDR